MVTWHPLSKKRKRFEHAQELPRKANRTQVSHVKSGVQKQYMALTRIRLGQIQRTSHPYDHGGTRPPLSPSSQDATGPATPSQKELGRMKFDKFLDHLRDWITSQTDIVAALTERVDNAGAHSGSDSLDGSHVIPMMDVELNEPAEQQDLTAIEPPSATDDCVLGWPFIRAFLQNAEMKAVPCHVTAVEERSILELQHDFDAKNNEDRDNKARSVSLQWSASLVMERPRCKPNVCSHGFRLGPSENQVAGLLESFVTSVHSIHPFMDLPSLRKTMTSYQRKYCSRNESITARAIFLRQPQFNEWPEKRSRACDCHPLQEIERSPGNAIVLLVLALGEVAASPAHLLASVASLTQSKTTEYGKSAESLPGLHYFSQAACILGEHLDGSELPHAHMFLLAGLYKAQLARPIEAASWYNAAGRVLSHLVRRKRLFYDTSSWDPQSSVDKQSKSQGKTQSHEEEWILRAAWTCIQLENEMSPCLRTPSSELGQFQHLLFQPTGAENQGEQSATVEKTATALVQLSKVLATRHPSPGNAQPSANAINREIKQQAVATEDWRNGLPHGFQWEDDDPPASDMSIARLRSAYWQAKLKLLKSFLQYLLLDKNEAGSQHGSLQHRLMAAVKQVAASFGESEILRLAHMCIFILKKSISAYDRVTGRPVFSNIHSTAHSRFQNVLLLIAARKCPELELSTPKWELQSLFASTKEFLKAHSTLSPTCAADLETLQGLEGFVYDR